MLRHVPGRIVTASQLFYSLAAAQAEVPRLCQQPAEQKHCYSNFLSDDTDVPSQLSVQELHYSAKMARLSGLCYGNQGTLAARLQAEGLQAIAQGQTSFTR